MSRTLTEWLLRKKIELNLRRRVKPRYDCLMWSLVAFFILYFIIYHLVLRHWLGWL